MVTIFYMILKPGDPGIRGVPGEKYIAYYDERTRLSQPQPQKFFPGYPALLPGNFHFLKNKFAQPCFEYGKPKAKAGLKTKLIKKKILNIIQNNQFF